MFNVIIQHKPVFHVHFLQYLGFIREPSQKKVNEKVHYLGTFQNIATQKRQYFEFLKSNTETHYFI